MEVENAVRERYSQGALERDSDLCCPVTYDPKYLEAIPREVLERDYGCGDPSRHVREGDTVLDLGSGGGKICFIAAQAAGPTGRVIGVDMNEEMLAMARRAAPMVAASIGHANVVFRRGRIQDLRLDIDMLDAWLAEHPVRSAAASGISVANTTTGNHTAQPARIPPHVPTNGADALTHLTPPPPAAARPRHRPASARPRSTRPAPASWPGRRR